MCPNIGGNVSETYLHQGPIIIRRYVKGKRGPEEVKRGKGDISEHHPNLTISQIYFVFVIA